MAGVLPSSAATSRTAVSTFRLAWRGVVAHTVSSFGLHKEYHTPADDLSRIDFAHMTRAIQSMLSPIEWLVNATFVPAWHEGQRPAPGARPTRQ